MKRKLLLKDEVILKLKKIRENFADIMLDDEESSQVKSGAGCGDYCRYTCSYFCEKECQGSCRFASGDHACAYKSVAPPMPPIDA